MSNVVVLVVEDEPLVRMNAVGIVEDAGYQAIEATNADDALKILNSRDDVQVVFTDIDMPGSMNGAELVKAVSASYGPVSFLVTSGLVKPHTLNLPEHSQFIPKPYEFDEITMALNELAQKQ